MRSRWPKPLNAFMAILAAMAWTAFAQDTSLDGDWLASLQTGERIQHLTLHVTQGLGESSLSRSKGSAAPDGTIRAGERFGLDIDFHIFIADVNFDGTLSSDARRMSGT